MPALAGLQFIGVSGRIYTQLEGLDDVVVPATIERKGDAASAIRLSGVDIVKALEGVDADVDPRLLEALPMMRAESRPAKGAIPAISAPRPELLVSGEATGNSATCH